MSKKDKRPPGMPPWDISWPLVAFEGGPWHGKWMFEKHGNINLVEERRLAGDNPDAPVNQYVDAGRTIGHRTLDVAARLYVHDPEEARHARTRNVPAAAR